MRPMPCPQYSRTTEKPLLSAIGLDGMPDIAQPGAGLDLAYSPPHGLMARRGQRVARIGALPTKYMRLVSP